MKTGTLTAINYLINVAIESYGHEIAQLHH